MKVVVALDSFKGSLTSLEAGEAVKEAVLKLDNSAEVIVLPLADGGEGTVEALSSQGEKISLCVTGPLGAPVTAEYAITENGTAVVEMASAAGITLVPDDKKNPLYTTTFGVGEIILDAIKRGCRRFIVGIGGSATNDGGVGMLSALGYEFLDGNGAVIEPGAAGLEKLDVIKCDKVLPELSECRFRVACDVDAVLCGERGCSAVFARQKGATPEMIEKMDTWLENYARITKEIIPEADPNYAGVGAAGGLGFAFHAFTDSRLESGVSIILDEIHLEDYIKTADVVVTGEGRLDSQSAMGKAPVGVARLAKKYNKRVIAFSGCVAEDAEILNERGIDAFFPILRKTVTLEEALDKKNARENLKATAYQVFRLYKKAAFGN